jgi:hypothetical protein
MGKFSSEDVPSIPLNSHHLSPIYPCNSTPEKEKLPQPEGQGIETIGDDGPLREEDLGLAPMVNFTPGVKT